MPQDPPIVSKEQHFKYPSAVKKCWRWIALIFIGLIALFLVAREKWILPTGYKREPAVASGVASTDHPSIQSGTSLPGAPAEGAPEGVVSGENSAVGVKPADSPAVPPYIRFAMSRSDWPTVRLGLYLTWGEADPLAAIAHARDNNPGASTMCIASVLGGWTVANRGEAVKWVSAQIPNAEKSLWFTSLVNSCPDEDLDAMGSDVGANLGNPGGLQTAEIYGAKLIKRDPTSAFEWISRSVFDPDLSPRAATQIMSSWACAETEAASGWLATVPQDAPWRDAAIEGLVLSVSSMEPEVARQWAAAIGQDELRERVSKMIPSNSASN
jgi:hypothetical protein